MVLIKKGSYLVIILLECRIKNNVTCNKKHILIPMKLTVDSYLFVARSFIGTITIKRVVKSFEDALLSITSHNFCLYDFSRTFSK